LQKLTLTWAKSQIWAKHVKIAKLHKLHARKTILIIRPSQTPASTSCHVKSTEPCAYFYIWDFSLVGIMQRFSSQSKLNLAHMTWEHIFQAISISFSDSYLVHEMSLRQKGTYAPPQDKVWGINIHDGKWAVGPIWSKWAIQPQIKRSQATKTCQDHIKAFTHKRAYMWHFSKT
jgi:hypothetical protein